MEIVREIMKLLSQSYMQGSVLKVNLTSLSLEEAYEELQSIVDSRLYFSKYYSDSLCLVYREGFSMVYLEVIRGDEHTLYESDKQLKDIFRETKFTKQGLVNVLEKLCKDFVNNLGTFVVGVDIRADTVCLCTANVLFITINYSHGFIKSQLSIRWEVMSSECNLCNSNEDIVLMSVRLKESLPKLMNALRKYMVCTSRVYYNTETGLVIMM